jgi:hypothetical protein
MNIKEKFNFIVFYELIKNNKYYILVYCNQLLLTLPTHICINYIIKSITSLLLFVIKFI